MSRKIHIGIVGSSFGNFNRGGAEVQIENTVLALNKIEGITTETITSETSDIRRFDLIHFFNSSVANYFFAEFLINSKIPYVVSTIIYPENEIVDIVKYRILHHTPGVSKISIVKLQYYIWENASKLFPNTDKELDFLRKIGVKTNAKIIPNGLNLAEMELSDKSAFYQAFPFLENQKFVLNVARIDQRKNQKRLVQACKELDLPVVLIGNNLDKTSFEELEALNYSKMYYLGPIFDKKILFGAYEACAVFCLPSTMETPGIAAMEAAYFNKPIVITKYGGTEYYFKDKAFYVNWRKLDEIKKGIATMMSKETVHTRDMMRQFSWDKIAETYVDEYEKILS